jgi:hypothetical protein
LLTLGNGGAIAINLISDLAFAGLIALARWGASKTAGSDPRYRKSKLLIIAVLWALGNGVYFVTGLPFYSLFLFATVLVCGWVLYRELHQFWRVGLVGVDGEIRVGIDYDESLRMCLSSLDFLGIGAAKLTGSRSAFQEAVSRCDRPGRPIRLLLSRPDNEGLRKIAQRAGAAPEAYQRTVQESLRVIGQLREQEKNIQVRFYQDFPAFRLMFINDNVCLASHYVLGKGDGSQLPQLHIVKTGSSRDVESLYYAFQEYFESIWQDSEEWDFRAYLRESRP